MKTYKTIILGAGAAGLFCAKFASLTKGDTLIIDHAKAPAQKVRISGGGRCNFTNIYTSPDNFLSENPHFIKSALARYTQWDFIDLLAQHNIKWHEKTLGQLFCDGKSDAIIKMLMQEAVLADIWLKTEITNIQKLSDHYIVNLKKDEQDIVVKASNIVVATGGKSIPKMGASGIGYQIAKQFEMDLIETRPALVPLTFSPHELEWIKPLAGTAVDGRLSANHTQFDEALLFTHRGLSGPSVLQISSYWREGDEIKLNLSPQKPLLEQLQSFRSQMGKKQLQTALSKLMSQKLAQTLLSRMEIAGIKTTGNLADFSDKDFKEIADQIHELTLKPTGTEGYRTAEVTLGGVDTDNLSSKTMESKANKGLYFIGEVVDVTGWLGGYNFQWAWSSAAACGRAIAQS